VVFVDTNVLVYALDRTAGDKQRQAMGWMDVLWTERAGRISTQILKEFYSTITRKLRPGIDATRVRSEVERLWVWNPITLDRAILGNAWQIQDRYRLSFWDCLVVASAAASDCPYLLSEDLQHDQDLGGIRVIDPFRVAPADILD
jgi:predicted nucleic acid-binding protein